MNQENTVLHKVSVAAWKFSWEMQRLSIFHGSEFSDMYNVVKRGLKRRRETVWCLETKSVIFTVRKENHKVCFVFLCYKNLALRIVAFCSHHGICLSGKKGSSGEQFSRWPGRLRI